MICSSIFNKYIYIGIILGISALAIVYYIYDSYYDHNDLKFISFTDRIYKYKINYYNVDIVIPDEYVLVNNDIYYDECYIIGKFKNNNIICSIKLNYDKNTTIHPYQEKAFIDFKTKWIDFYKSLNNETYLKHIILDNSINIYAIAQEFSPIMEGFTFDYIIEIGMLKDDFNIDIEIQLESDIQLTQSQLYDIYLPWKNCNMMIQTDSLKNELEKIENEILKLKE